jgi:hypothetical protein
MASRIVPAPLLDRVIQTFGKPARCDHTLDLIAIKETPSWPHH